MKVHSALHNILTIGIAESAHTCFPLKCSNLQLFLLINFHTANSHPNSDDEEDEDNDYTPEDDEFKKVNYFSTLTSILTQLID